MNKKKFYSENFLMSAAGHLAVFAFMITSFLLINGTAEKIIAQNRVQITEIDLSQVQITRDETKVHNTNVADVPEPVVKTIEVKQKPEDTGDDEPMDKPAVITDTKKSDTKPISSAPQKRTVVRVNRDTGGLNRTMTVSVVDALRVALTRCWVIDNDRSDIKDIRATAHLTMSKNGMVQNVWFESASSAETDAGFAYVLETIRGAITACQPFKMLPVSEFDYWEKIQLTFYPSSGTIL